MKNDTVKVLYIAGEGRSGSTILGNILGQVDGFFFVGELLNIWRHFLIDNRLCGCGKPPRECTVWQPVIRNAFGKFDEQFPQDMEYHRRHSNLNRYIPLYMFPASRSWLRGKRKPYLDNLETLYINIQKATACNVIVDGSKRPTYGELLGMLTAIDLYVVHLVRDPRAVAYSWKRKKIQTDGGNFQTYMQRMSPLTSSIRWNIMNFATEFFWRKCPERYLLLRYEDIVKNPHASIQKILDLINIEQRELPFSSDRTVRLSINHIVWGNPNRHNTGSVELYLDDEWKQYLSTKDKWIVDFLTLPMRHRYGYTKDT